jgi:hypothetical protein
MGRVKERRKGGWKGEDGGGEEKEREREGIFKLLGKR